MHQDAKKSKVSAASPIKKTSGKKHMKQFNEPDAKLIKIEKVERDKNRSSAFNPKSSHPIDPGASPLKEEQALSCERSAADKANDFSVDESSDMHEVFPDDTISTNELIQQQMNDMAEELLLDPAKKKGGFSPLSSGLKEGDKKLRISATPFQPKSQDRLTDFDPGSLVPPPAAQQHSAALGALLQQTGGHMFNPQAMKNVQEAAGFLPLIKLVLGSVNAATQIQLTKFLLSLQPRNDSKDPSQDYLELRAQYENMVDEVKQQKTIIDQLKEQRLEKIEESKAQLHRIRALEAEVTTLSARLAMQERAAEIEQEYEAFEKARRSQCLSYQKSQGVASGGPSRFQRAAHAEGNHSNFRPYRQGQDRPAVNRNHSRKD